MHPAPGALRRRRPGSYRPPSGAPPPACTRPQDGPLPTARRRHPLPRHGTPFGLRSPPRSGGGGDGNGCGGPSRSSSGGGGSGSSAAPAPPRRPPEPHAPPARPAAGLLPPKPTTKPPPTPSPQPRSVRIQLRQACCPFLTPLRTRALGFALRPLASRPGAKRVESLHAGSPPWLAGARSTRPPFPWRPPPSRDEDSRIVANKSHLAKGEGAAGAREARAQTPRKLAFAAAALPRASLSPLAAPPIYLRPRPRPDPARNSTPLLHPRLPLPSPSPRWSGPAPSAAPPRPTARSRAQQVPRTRPPPPRPGQSGRAWFPPPAAPRPRIHVLLRHPTRPDPGSARAQAIGVPGSVRCTATHPALAWVPAWPAACARRADSGARSWSRSRCRPRSRRRCRVSPRGLGPRKIRTRAGWGPRKASFFIFSPPPPQGRAVPPFPAPTEPPSPGQSPSAAVATLLFSTLPGKRAKREEEGGKPSRLLRRPKFEPTSPRQVQEILEGQRSRIGPGPAPGSRAPLKP
ncbi:uncharacterized protein [Pseudorca crassidens]|uniref:uncharacterized protein n=1 Tax=Pseudorca crassidens TaxID=82174 RepID=UPI00352DF03D